MAGLRLGRYEVERYNLPPVCARCGDKAVATPDKRFAWHPPWLAVLILLGLLGIVLYVILANVLTKRMTVALPLCERHRQYWRNRKIFIYGGVLGVLLLGLLAAVIGAVLDSNRVTESGLLFAVLSAGGLFLLWLLCAAVLQTVTIRPNEITDRSIALAGLSEEFVAEVREDRRGREDDEDDRPRARRRRHDDEDDRPRRGRSDEDEGGYYDPQTRRRIRRGTNEDDR
jgi:hypothetical protein